MKVGESIPDTKGRESWTPQAFFPANRQLLGDREGGHDGDRGPLWPAPSGPGDMIPLGRDRTLSVVEIRPGSEPDGDPVLVVEAT
jgi:hypothetical protein